MRLRANSVYRLGTVVLCLTSALALGQSTGGTVIPSGGVSLNGKSVRVATAIFPKDKLSISSGSSASITSRGAVASVEDRTTLIFGKNELDLDCGQVEVATIFRFAVLVNKVTVTPQNIEKTTFEVRQENHRLKVQALERVITVAQGDEVTTLNPGESKEIANSKSCPFPAPVWVRPTIWVGSWAWVPFVPEQRNNISGFRPD